MRSILQSPRPNFTRIPKPRPTDHTGMERSIPGGKQSRDAATIWLTGLSGSGKTTVANILAGLLEKRGQNFQVLDGDELRASPISEGLKFSENDRFTNVRRIAFLAKLLNAHGVIAIVPVIAPLKRDRDAAREIAPNFIEVYMNTPLAICEERDPKGLYRRARNGEIEGFTGIDSPYEAPLSPDIVCFTQDTSPNDCAEVILNYLDSSESALIREHFSPLPHPSVPAVHVPDLGKFGREIVEES